jgi:hypothetical protein
MRNIPKLLCAALAGACLLSSSLLSTAWAVDPLVGPGKVGEKDEKGGVKGATAGAGPHLHFKNEQQLQRRVDRPEEAIEKEQKEKAAKARQEEKQTNK